VWIDFGDQIAINKKSIPAAAAVLAGDRVFCCPDVGLLQSPRLCIFSATKLASVHSNHVTLLRAERTGKKGWGNPVPGDNRDIQVV
jgi:hypothetical protein